jgi:dimethylglycine dehydrogenase
MAYVRPDHAAEGTALTIKMLDRHYPARVVCDSPYDSANERSRMAG